MFQKIERAAPDPILGLTDAFRADPSPNKINLGVGIYQDEDGRTPVLDVVREAERRMAAAEESKVYLPIDGPPEFGAGVQVLLLGAGHEAIAAGRLATSLTPGGTGALRVFADYLAEHHPGASVWLSDPTWANHAKIMEAARVPVRTYPYYDAERRSLDADAMLAALREVKAGDVVLLHGCCHNPTGVDLAPEHWTAVADLLGARGAAPLVDLAYQGFADGIEQDAAGVRALVSVCPEVVVCSSFSKNFGLYRERTGALSFIGRSADVAGAVQSNIKLSIRHNYSNPPAHGGLIVSTVLRDPQLRRRWDDEVATMRGRLNQTRRAFVAALDQRGVSLGPRGNAFLSEQKGMFSFSGLTPGQVQALRERYSIYVVGSGRINVAGINQKNLARLCDAIAEVTRAAR